MKIVKRLLLLFVLLAVLCGLLAGLARFLLPKLLRSWCRKQGIEYQYSRCVLRLPGKLTLSEFQLQKEGDFSISAERLELSSSLLSCLTGKWNIEHMQIDNGSLSLRGGGQLQKLHLSQISLQLLGVAPGKTGSAALHGQIEEIDLRRRGLMQGGNLSVNAVFEFSKKWLFERVQGQLEAIDVALSREGTSLGAMSAIAKYSFQQDTANSWLIIPSAGESEPINQLKVNLDHCEVIDVVFKSGTWEKTGDGQAVSLEISSHCLDSDPLLGLISPQIAAWVGARLNFLQLELRGSGKDSASLLDNMQGSLVFDIDSLSLKNSPFIELFSSRTALDLTEFLHFNRGSGILKINNRVCRFTTTAPFCGPHPVITANGTAAFDGQMKIKLKMGFSPELEKLLETKSYFLPFAKFCQHDNGYLMLPGSLTLTGSIGAPSVDVTELLKASAKAGVQNLFEDAAGRIGIRLRHSKKDGAKKNKGEANENSDHRQ